MSELKPYNCFRVKSMLNASLTRNRNSFGGVSNNHVDYRAQERGREKGKVLSCRRLELVFLCPGISVNLKKGQDKVIYLTQLSFT